jgi:predicted nucleotidyltransferase
MLELNLDNIAHAASVRIRPFFEGILGGCPEKIHSLYVTGSALTGDFNDKTSDVNSLVVLNESSFDFLRFIAPLGKKFGKKGVAAPLIMTPSYIDESLDVFPMEFLELKMIHKLVYGKDILGNIKIENPLLRLQCEREIKTRLIGLRQGYISVLGEPKQISLLLARSMTGCIPLFRAVILLMGGEPPVEKSPVIEKLSETAKLKAAPFMDALALKQKLSKKRETVLPLFEAYYTNLEALSDIINAL